MKWFTAERINIYEKRNEWAGTCTACIQRSVYIYSYRFQEKTSLSHYSIFCELNWSWEKTESSPSAHHWLEQEETTWHLRQEVIILYYSPGRRKGASFPRNSSANRRLQELSHREVTLLEIFSFLQWILCLQQSLPSP